MLAGATAVAEAGVADIGMKRDQTPALGEVGYLQYDPTTSGAVPLSHETLCRMSDWKHLADIAEECGLQARVQYATSKGQPARQNGS